MKSVVVIHPYYFSTTKRVVELSIIALFLPILLLMMLALSIGLLLANGAPVLFWQQRLGQHKKPFWLVKFRTMKKNAESEEIKLLKLNESTYPAFKIKNDPRFVRGGKWLSASGLDEIPQIWNIVKGEMSLIGPRPLPIHQAKKLPTSFHFKYKVKPGLISLWIFSKNRHHSLRQWKELEANTLRKGGIVHDFSLVGKTIVMLSQMILSSIKK